MAHLTPQDLTRQMHWRYAVKKFDPSRAIDGATWHALEQALVLSPSSFGLQPWRFAVVTSRATKDRLPPISWNQDQVRDASHVVVFAARTTMTASDVDRLIDRSVAVRAVARATLEGYRGMMLGFVTDPPPGLDLRAWAACQTYIAMGTLLTAAAVIGVDACPMEGINGPEYDRLLSLDAAGYATLAVVALGYRATDDVNAALPKVRFPVEQVIQRA